MNECTIKRVHNKNLTVKAIYDDINNNYQLVLFS